MSWSISRSWQAPNIITTIAAVGEDLLVSAGLEIMLLDQECKPRWIRSLPFRVHAAIYSKGMIGILSGHGFNVIRANDGSQIGEGRSTSGGFSDILARPGGGWVLSCRRGQLHVFNHEGKGLKRLDSGKVRRLVGWFDREHLMWQDDEGKLRCARLANDDSQRILEQRVWSWVSRMVGGKVLLQSADGMLWEGLPHPYGWDSLEMVESRSLEPLCATRCGDGWWVLSVEGGLNGLISEQTPESAHANFGDMLIGMAADTMVTASRSGLVRIWQSPELAALRRIELQKQVAAATVANDWEERRTIFKRACAAEDEGRISLAIDLYQSLGRSDDVNRLLNRQRGE